MTEKINEKLKIRFYFVLEVLNATGFLTENQKPNTSYSLENFNEQEIEVYNRAKTVSNRVIRECVSFNYEAGYFLHLFSKLKKGTYDAFDVLEAVDLYEDILEKIKKAEKEEEKKEEKRSKEISKYINDKIIYESQKLDSSSGDLSYEFWDSTSTNTYDYSNLD